MSLEGVDGCEGGTGQDSARRETNDGRTEPWVALASRVLGVGRKGACCSADVARADGRGGASGLAQITKGLLGSGGYYYLVCCSRQRQARMASPKSTVRKGGRTWPLLMSTSATTR